MTFIAVTFFIIKVFLMLGLSRKIDENCSRDDIYGIMPLCCSGSFRGEEQFTQEADIYGFGVIMAEITTGRKPFRWL